jgi:cyclophilin family peptidyl-prolyl cis-trans isomerase
MRWITRKMFDLLGYRLSRKPRSRRDGRRLSLEFLEGRLAPAAATFTSTISGVAFVDANGNHAFNSKEAVVPGIAVTLYGRDSIQHRLVDVTATTNSQGAFKFENVQPGTYEIGSNTRVLVHEITPKFSGLQAPPGVTVFARVTVTAAETLTQNVGFLGLTPAFVSQAQLLSTSSNTVLEIPSIKAGTGVALASSRPDSTPTVSTAIANVTATTNGSTQIDLAGHFSDADFSTHTILQINTTLGSFEVEMFDDTAPQTVQNFLDYVTMGLYKNDVFHRLDKGANGTTPFVLQGGGFTYVGGTKPALNPVVTLPNVPSEAATTRSNTAGTLAMALSGSDANSGNSQFFINLGNNATTLDPGNTANNPAFTVFAKIVGQTSTTSISNAIVNKLTSEPTPFGKSLSSTDVFAQIPLINYKGTRSTFPGDTTASNLEVIKSIKILKRGEALTYSLVSNQSSTPGLVAVKFQGEHMTLSYAKGASGTATIVVKASDQFGASVTTSFTVTVNPSTPSATVTLNNTRPTPVDTITATATTSNTDGDPVTLTYVWKDTTTGAVLQTTSNTSATTDKLNLNGIAGVTAGDVIQVSVTPTSDGVTGTAATSSATVTSPSTPSATVVLDKTSPALNDTITATATTANTDGDPVTLTYVWTDTTTMTILQTTGPTSATTDKLDLAKLSGVSAGDTIQVSVTPASDGLTGAAATAPTPATVQAVSTPSATVTLDNSNPTPIDTITATAAPSNADGHPVTLTYVWTDTTNPQAGPNGNGVLQTTSNTSAITDKLNLKGLAGVNVGDVIQVSVTPAADGLTGTAVTANATVQAVSTPSATVKLDNDTPTAFDTVTATATTSNTDGHAVTLTYKWTDTTNLTAGPNGNGVLQTTSNTSATTDKLNLKGLAGINAGDVIQVTVTPAADGLTGTAVAAQATIQAPSTPSATVKLDNATPNLTQTIIATATTSNADHDPVTLTYVWKDTTNTTLGTNHDGVLQTTSNSSALTDKLNLANATGVAVGDTIEVTVTPASDGVTGTAVTATATVVHTTPSATVALNNTSPTVFDTVTATATTSNADGGAVMLTYVWTDTTNATAGPNGDGVLRTTSNTSATTDQLDLNGIAGVNTGDVIQVSVTPVSNGQTGTAATAPTPATVHATSTPSATVQLDRSTPTLNDTVTATATTSNADHDPVTLTYIWTDTTNATAGANHDGVLQTTSNVSALTDQLNLKNAVGVNAGDVIELSVTPASDGKTGTAVAATFTVAVDTAPVVDGVTMSPTTATTTSTLTATPTGHDPDGDSVTFLYQWSIEGEGTVTGANTNTLNLSALPAGFTVSSGSKVSVIVTPFDGTLDGTAFTQTVTLS